MKSEARIKPGTGEIVSITVGITQDARKKLREIKGILGYTTLDKTINTAVEIVEMRKVFDIAINAHGLASQIEPMVESKESEGSTYERCTDDERKLIDLLKDRLEDLKVDTIGQLTALIDSDIIKIRNTTQPQISPAGEMPDMED